MLRPFLTWVMLCCPLLASSHQLNGQVVDSNGQPLEYVVVSLHGQTPYPELTPAAAAEVVQENRAFAPFVLAIPQGTQVSFPNRDPFKHHVYSFAPAKRFEIRLYAGEPKEPVRFDKPGIVPLGCNIHDYMLAYVYVSETPYFATTDAEGKFSIDQLPAEAFELKLWHPSFKLRAAKAATQLTITPGQQTLPPLTLGVKAATPPPTPDALQQRMNKFYDDDYLEF